MSQSGLEGLRGRLLPVKSLGEKEKRTVREEAGAQGQYKRDGKMEKQVEGGGERAKRARKSAPGEGQREKS